jgi:protein O-mannosyl-transferase
MLLVYTIAGLSPGLWHLSSVLLHVIVTFLVFRLSSVVLNGRVAAGSAALLFAIHPVHVEDVCWVSASNEMLYSGLLLLSILFLFRSQIDGGVWLRLSIAAWDAALLTKETAIALLPLFVVLGFWGCSKSKLKKCAKTALAYVAVAAGYFTVRSIVLQNMLGKPSGEASWRQVLDTSPIVAKFYLWKLGLSN